MKFSSFTLFLIALFAFVACNKQDLKKEKEEKDEIAFCEWDGSKVADANIWTTYVSEPIVTNEDCGCITSGVVKYVKNETEFAYEIYYGKGECNKLAYLVTYYDDKDKQPTKCKFELDCIPEGN